MKLNKTMKKILAFVLSLAMVVSSFGLNVVSAADEWVSTENGWINLEEEGYNRVDAGGNRYAVEGISAVYAGHWAGVADIDILRNTEDPYTMTIDVKSRGNKADWIIQVAYSVRNLDSSKMYTVDLKIDDKVASSKTVNGKETSNEIINLGQSDDLGVGQHTLTVVATELVKGDEPVVVQPITITPNEAEIAATKTIWASWTNPEGTAKAYAYLEEVKEENGVCIAGKGWIFNTQAVQPMTSVDKVARTQGDTDTITVEPGKTYKFIVVSYTAFGDKNGEGSIDITIPSKTQEEIKIDEILANPYKNLTWERVGESDYYVSSLEGLTFTQKRVDSGVFLEFNYGPAYTNVTINGKELPDNDDVHNVKGAWLRVLLEELDSNIYNVLEGTGAQGKFHIIIKKGEANPKVTFKNGEKDVDADVVTAKAQFANDGKIRFVSSVDSLDYQEVGFKVSGTYGDKTLKQKLLKTSTVYAQIYAGNELISASDAMGVTSSAYCFTYAVTGLDASTNSKWTVTPYVVKNDGVRVLGETKTFTITDGVLATE